LLTFLAALLALATSAPAQKQANPYGTAGANLTKEDWTLLNAAKAKVMADPAAVGTEGSWTNPKSGHSGTIKITKAFDRGERRCRTVAYAFDLWAKKTSGTYLVSECKAADGRWGPL
jgi:surface antigen